MPELGFVEHAQRAGTALEREEHGRRLDVAAVIAGVDGAAGLDVLARPTIRNRKPASAKPRRTPAAPAA